MSKIPTSQQLIKNTQEFLDNQGLTTSTDKEDKLERLYQMLEKSRSTQSALYGWEPPHGNNLLRRAKNTIQIKLKNIILNTLEKYVMRQQKYNELVYQALVQLKHENEYLKSRTNGPQS